uniref:B box-type domain-containing protein n=1 Tax=Leersia perrieri TaxID=77586 RepID=A0A0D9X502_9ORYZ
MSSAAAPAPAAEGKEKGSPPAAVAGACELCGAAARVYCGADEATLCWGCDAQVHGANFLVARHARALLCRGCARPTPWRAAGPRLGPTASLCHRCVPRGGAGAHGRRDEEMGGGDDGDVAEDDDEEEEDDEEDNEEGEGEGENQVVPWAAEEAEAVTPPPVASSTSSSSREAPAATAANAADHAKEDQPCSTSQPGLCRYASSARHGGGGRSDEATSSRNGSGGGGGRFLASRHRKRSPSDFRRSGSAQSVSGTQGRNCSNAAAIGRNDFS